MRGRLSRLLRVVGLLPALLTAAGAAAQGSASALEIAVFEALLGHGLDDGQRLLVIGAETTGDPAAIATHEDAARALIDELGAPPETLDSWIRMNAASVALDHPLDLDVSYQLLDATGRAALFDAAEPRRAWETFFARYPGAPGLLRLSRVGFDTGLAHALVYVEHQCGMECGAGRLVHLVRGADGAWSVRGAGLIWMADGVPVPQPEEPAP